MGDPVIRFLVCLLVFAVISEFGECARTSKKIYITLDKVQGCFRRLNATHQIGCGSQMGGNVGVIHHIESDADIEWILQYGPHAPYIALMSSLNFNVTNVNRLKDSGKINGILVSHVLSNDSVTPIPPGGFSPDHSCPQDAFGMYNNNSEYKHCKPVTWNPVGSSMMYEDFGIPIFVLLNETEVNSVIYDCYEKFNKPNPDGTARKYPLCSAELKGAMYAAKDSVTCIRRTKHVVNLNVQQYCDPLGDKNVFATVKEITNDQTLLDDQVIVAAARIDAFTLFEKVTPSADNDVTGFVTLLAAAEALSRSGAKDLIHNNTLAKDILFTFFQGEAFDYIGSSRMVYEMEKDRFPKSIDKNDHDNKYLHPINLHHISHLVEVNQLGFGKNNVWVHTDPISRNNTQIDNEVTGMVSKLVDLGQEYGITAKAAGANQPLPPGSVQRFLRKRSIPTVLLSDHQKEFANKFYNGRFDTAEEIGASYPENLNQSEWYDYVTPQAENLAAQAGLLAQFLYSLSTGEDQFIPADKTVVTHLLYCFLYNGSCDLFQTVVDKTDADKLEEVPYPFYVSVARNTNHVSFLIKKLLAYFLGEQIAVDKSECKASVDDKYHQYYWMQGPVVENSTKRAGVCYRSTADFSEAKSPVFLDEMSGYDWATGEYSSWTESTWDSLAVRMFLVPSQQFQMLTFGIGIAILLLSHCLVYFMTRKAGTIFFVAPSSPVSTAN